MAFDFYFAGTQAPETDILLKDLNCNILKSYVNDKKSIEKWFEYKRNGWKGKLLIDNGAFTVHRKGGSVNIDDYIKWLNDNIDLFDYAIALDDIPGKWGERKTTEEVALSPQKTFENYLYMVEHVIKPNKLLPVFHMGESFEWLEKYLKLPDLKYICISGNKELTNAQREEWYEKCFYVIKHSSNPNIQTHCLGSATLSNAIKFPFTSMDATSWIMTGANGNILTDIGAVYVGNIESINKLPVDAKTTILKLLSKYGITLEQVTTDYKARMLYNIHYLYEKSLSTSYQGIGFKKRSLF